MGANCAAGPVEESSLAANGGEIRLGLASPVPSVRPCRGRDFSNSSDIGSGRPGCGPVQV